MDPDEDKQNFENTFPKSPVGTLIARISKMLKNPVIDAELDETLDNFLDQLHESQRYLSHGIFNVKFAEAGLFLQNAVTLYGKKVDSLWDSTLQYQMQLCSYTKPSEGNVEEATVITQRLNRNKRKKITLPDGDGSNSLYDDLNAVCDRANNFIKGRCAAAFQHFGESSQNNPLLNDHNSDSALNASSINDGNHSVCGFHFPVDSPVNNLQSGEKLCNYSDLYLNCVVPFLETSKSSAENINSSSEYSMTTRKNDWLLQKYVTERRLTNKKFWTKTLGDDFEIFRQAHEQEAYNIETNIRSSLDEQARSLCPQAFVVKLPRLPDELMSEYGKNNSGHLKELIQDLLIREKGAQESAVAQPIKKCSERISDADSLFHDGPFHDLDDTDAAREPCDILMSQRSCADSGICLSEGIVMESCADFMSSEDLPNICSNLDIVESFPIENCQLGSDTFAENSIDQIVENIGRNEYVVDSLDALQNNNEDITTGIKNLASETISAVSRQITVVHKSNLKPMKNTDTDRKNLKRKLLQDQDDKLEKRKKPRTRFRWLKTTTTTLTTFENFFKHNYQPEFGEGDIVDYESDEEIDVLPLNDDLQNEEMVDAPVLDTIPPSTIELSAGAVFDELAGHSIQEEGDPTASPVLFTDFSSNHENENIVQTVSMETTTSNIQEDVASVVNTEEVNIPNDVSVLTRNSESESIERLKAVTEWKKFIEPKLQAAEQSCKFDIHEYGTRIMDAIPVEKNLNFQHLADGKPSSEVARLFLASLQLANTYNIELVSSHQGDLANDNLEIKLLSRERFHEHLDEYEAPSENSFREKLARVQALQPSLPLHSTPSRHRSSIKYKRKRNSYIN